MAPVLCIIHDAELFFAKKLTADEKQLEVARHKRLMRRFIKKIQPGERLMFIGLTSQPYRARVKPLLQIYQFIILFPKPNYGSRRSNWNWLAVITNETMLSDIELLQTFLTENHQMLIDDIELSVLASISKGYTAGQLLDTAEKVIGLKRSQKYPNSICSAQDFLSILGLQTPIFLDEEKKIKVSVRLSRSSFTTIFSSDRLGLVWENTEWSEASHWTQSAIRKISEIIR